MRFNSAAASNIEEMLISVDGATLMLCQFIENNADGLSAYDALNLTACLLADGHASVALGNGDEVKLIRLDA